MQRLLALLMVLVLLAGVLIACTPEQLDTPTTNKTQPTTQNTEPGTVPTTVQPTNPTSPADPTEPAVPDVPPELPAQDFFTRYGQGVPAEKQVPDYALSTDTPNLYSLPLDLPGSDLLRQVVTYGDTLYISYWYEIGEMPEGCGLRAIDLTTGSTLYDVTCPEWSEFGPLDAGGLWFFDYEHQTMYFYDGAGQMTTAILDTSAVNHDEYTYDICVDPSGRYAVFLYDTDVPVVIHNLSTGSVTMPEFAEGTFFLTAQYQQGQMLLSDYRNNACLLEPATGEYSLLNLAITFNDIQNGIGYALQAGGLVLAGIDGDPTCYYLEIPLGYWISDLSHGCAVLNSYEGGAQAHVLDLRKELHLADIAFPENCYTTFSLFLDNGSLLIVTIGDDGNYAYLYDTAAVVADAATLNTYLCTQEELQEETAQIAQDVLNETGIEILYGSQGNDFIVSDYVGVVELEPFKVFLAVHQVAELLEQYPEGMLREAWEATNSGIKVYLCGSIYGIWSSGLDQAGGLTTDVDNYIVVAIDINQPIDSVLYHELSHVFDRRIGDMWEQMDWFAVWESVHPFDYAYSYSYENYYNYTKYTPIGEKNPGKVWFVESYGRTFPTEDRATIMEMLCCGTDVPPAELEYEHILYKARLYSYILRQCFPSCDTEEVHFWERFLGVIDESVLP